jgi:predicted TIM-barrel fold metal-dependent hydrolase
MVKRNMRKRRLRDSWPAVLVVAASVLVMPFAEALAAPPEFVPWRADHHIHMRSQAIYDAFGTLCAQFDKRDCEVPDAAHPVRGAADVIAALDEAHVEKGVVLSMGYFFGSPYLAARHYDVARMTRAENEYVAEQVARNPKRLIGFFSVDPLSDSALEEVRFWADNRRLTGLKLHFANSGVHLKDPEQVRKIAAVVGLAGDRKLPMVIHLRAAHEFTAEEVEIFIRDILPRAGDSWVQIAHAAGWYGTDQVMFDDLAAFAAHIRRNDPVTRHTLFDLAEVVTTETTSDEAAALAKLMRQIGPKRFVMGSDYDFNSSTPKSTDDLTRAKLPLSNREWRVVARNCAPWAC